MTASFETPISRRGLLQSAAAGAVALSAPAVIRPARAAEDEIVLLTWETYDEDPWIEEWSKSSGVHVNAVRVGSVDEMFAKVRSGAVMPDLLYVDTSTFQHYREADVLVPIDISRIPNAKNISPAIHYQTTNVIDGKLFAVPYNWGPNPMMYRVDAVKEGADSWKTMWDPKYAGRVGIPDDAYITFQLLGIVSGAKNPWVLTDADFDACADLLRKLRPQVKTLMKGINDTEALFASGDLDLAFCLSIASVDNLQKNGKNVKYSLPKEGVPSWMDNTVMTKKGDRPIVYDFLNHTMSLPWQRRFVEFTVNPGVLDLKTAQAADVPAPVLDKTYMGLLDKPGFWDGLRLIGAPNDLDRRVQMFNDFKSGVL